MSDFNMPPGCSESHIPGNRPEDTAWEDLLEEIGQTAITAYDARLRWESQPDLLKSAKAYLDIIQGDNSPEAVKLRIAVANASGGVDIIQEEK